LNRNMEINPTTNIKTNKVAVVYKSKYGSTREYAQWIAEETEGDLFEATTVRGKDLERYDTIVYGGGMYAVGIMGIKLLRNNYENLKDKKIIVFSVGLAMESPEAMEHIKEKNFTEEMRENVELFMLRGAFDLDQLNIGDKMMMKTLKRKIQMKDPESLNEDERGIIQCCEQPMNVMDRESIKPIIDQVTNRVNVPQKIKTIQL